MQRVHLGQQPDVVCRIAPGKGGGGRAAQVFDPSLLQELRDTARNLGARQTGDLGQILTQHAPVGA